MKATIALGAVVGLLLLVFRGVAPPANVPAANTPTAGSPGMCLPPGKEV